MVTLVTAIAISFFQSTQKIKNTCQIMATSTRIKDLPASTSQILFVQSLGGFKAKITACQKEGTVWRDVIAPSFPAVVGAAGVAPPGKKREGDFKTPAGLFSIGEAFGSQPLALKMDFKYITPDDKFIDDATNQRYNTWISGTTDAKSYERMLIDLYKMGAIINYNINPTIVGAGSAIFMHVWRALDIPTSGCVAMDEHHLMAVLHWLDKNQHPYMSIAIS